MTQMDIFHIWAPPGALWSPWVKPTLFAHLNILPTAPVSELQTPIELDLSFLPATPAALVLDLPGPDAIEMAMHLAQRGYRPVPLYNAVPSPMLTPLPGTSVTLVDVHSILSALYRATAQLQALHLPKDAPPAFLLDANRRRGCRSAAPGDFDNRGISFITDFPSASFLLAHGLTSAQLIQHADTRPQPDLAHTLRGWQSGGLTLSVKRQDNSDIPSPLIIPKVSRFVCLLDRFWMRLGLKRHPLGGFGGMIPFASAG